uniref:Uncharacterized protein n=1 Tax=Setaria digitata TaxID=48799 RepID=A0A915PEI0_9BILA
MNQEKVFFEVLPKQQRLGEREIHATSNEKKAEEIIETQAKRITTFCQLATNGVHERSFMFVGTANWIQGLRKACREAHRSTTPDGEKLQKGEKRRRAAEHRVPSWSTIAVLAMRRCKDHNLDVCRSEPRINAKVMRRFVRVVAVRVLK